LESQYGKVGATGQTTSKDFPDAAKAKAFFAKQVAAKKKKGYADATDPAGSSSGKKRKAAASSAAAAPAQRARTTPTAPTAAPSGGGGGGGPSAGTIVEKSGLQGKGTIYHSGSDLYDIDIAFSGGACAPQAPCPLHSETCIAILMNSA
jgi:predicted DNA-binding WGR domain protein